MDPVAVLVVAFVAIMVLGLVRFAWRFVRGNEEMEAGGSYGRQMFGRRKRD